MSSFPLRRTAKLVSLFVLTAGIFVRLGIGLPSPSTPIELAPIPQKLVSDQERLSNQQHLVVLQSRSALQKEQAMSASELMDRWAPLIKEASRRFGISEDWIRAVMRMESGGRTVLDDGRPITSKAGAMGIMQVMPETYADMRQEHGLGADPHDPRNNVLAGTAYLRWLYGKYGYPEMFAAYNAGPATLEAQSAGVRELPAETRAYVSGLSRILGFKDPSPSKRTAQSGNGLVTLTRPDGSPISIDGAAVDSIRAPLPDEFAPGVQTVVAIGDKLQGVKENVATVAAIIKKHGGNI